ncbi:MAG: ABC transporter ATP-binding protein [Neisseriaceae bacterium]
MSNNYILDCQNICKTYKQADNDLNVLNDVNLSVSMGETVSIIGSSGSGKSTLLHILAGLDIATSGEVRLDSTLVHSLSDIELCKLRNKNLGFIYQFHHLLPEFTALENILMPLIIGGSNINKEKREKALDILGRLNLSNRHTHYPSQLSGGERQRVAIARAVINEPRLVFADEPTGNLDNQTSNQVLEIFFKLQEDLKTSLVIVTHDLDIAAKAQTQYRLHNSQLSRVSS